MLIHDSSILLDGAIRDWVLFPIMLVCVLVIIFRDQVTEVLKKSAPRELRTMKDAQILARTARFRTNAYILPARSIMMRKAYFTHPEQGPVALRSDPGILF